MFQAELVVTLRPVVNDPEGLTIKTALHALGFSAVQDVRAGKFLELTLDTADRAEAEAMCEAMARQLLANSVIEDYRVTVHPLASVAGREAS